jgi:hypothetical protein
MPWLNKYIFPVITQTMIHNVFLMHMIELLDNISVLGLTCAGMLKDTAWKLLKSVHGT